MPSRYKEGLEINKRRPNFVIFNDYEPILDQLQKYWLLRERFKRKGVRGIRRKKMFPTPAHLQPSDEGEQGPLV